MFGEHNDWSRGDYLKAALIDAVQVWSWAQLGSKKIPRPDPIPRPGDGPKRYRTELSGSEIERRLRAQLQRRKR